MLLFVSSLISGQTNSNECYCPGLRVRQPGRIQQDGIRRCKAADHIYPFVSSSTFPFHSPFLSSSSTLSFVLFHFEFSSLSLRFFSFDCFFLYFLNSVLSSSSHFRQVICPPLIYTYILFLSFFFLCFIRLLFKVLPLIILFILLSSSLLCSSLFLVFFPYQFTLFSSFCLLLFSKTLLTSLSFSLFCPLFLFCLISLLLFPFYPHYFYLHLLHFPFLFFLFFHLPSPCILPTPFTLFPAIFTPLTFCSTSSFLPC